MCIIVAKPRNTAVPAKEILRRCFWRNPDGAGFMYPKNGKVRIRKGFMKEESFFAALEELGTQVDLTETPIVFHFRIGTGGGNIPANTHPYPVNDNLKLLQSLNTKTDLGVVHNGIIDIRPRQKDINDTMEYIMSQLAPLKRAVPNFYENENLVQMIKNAITSKMAFLTTDGRIYTIGDFIEDEGILYSNDTYAPYTTKYTGTYWTKSKGVSGWDFPYSYGYEDDIWESYIEKRASKDSEKKLLSLPMMWLEDGEYIKSKNGDLLDSDTYALLLDEDDEVWSYEFETDKAFYIGGTAYTANGGILHYQEDRSEMVYAESLEYTEKQNKAKKEMGKWIIASNSK